MNWYVGQDVLLINAWKGTPYYETVRSIKGIMTTPCKCGFLILDVGIPLPSHYTSFGCNDCLTFYIPIISPYIWSNEVNFAPLDSFVNLEEIEELKRLLQPEEVF